MTSSESTESPFGGPKADRAGLLPEQMYWIDSQGK